MMLDEARTKQIKDVFKEYHDLKENAKAMNGSASDLLKGLVESLATSKAEKKTIGKILKKGYREWLETVQGEEETILQALEVVEKITE